MRGWMGRWMGRWVVMCVCGWAAGGCLDTDLCTERFHKQAPCSNIVTPLNHMLTILQQMFAVSLPPPR